jgi:plasmid stabilization system protein ParE
MPHPDAAADLAEIVEYISRFNPVAADRLVDEILAGIPNAIQRAKARAPM